MMRDGNETLHLLPMTVNMPGAASQGTGRNGACLRWLWLIT